MKTTKLFFTVLLLSAVTTVAGQSIIIDHHCAKLEPIPVWALEQAAESLHIAYGHTSHGSQLITGMTALAGQDTLLTGYKGDYYCWDYYPVPGENGSCIDIDDYFKPGDLGHNGDTQWAESTRDYLDNDPSSTDINVVMWSWCGGCSDNTVEGINIYLNTMNQLELDYPGIRFVYMTGHRDIWSDDTLKRNNQLIRDYCVENNKVLFDFADIESYDPDGVYYEFANDNCDYYDEDMNKLGNWAIEWQDMHEEGVDWYQCSPAHTQALNGNLKAYASWWLWCRLAGWDGTVGTETPDSATDILVFSRGKTIVLKGMPQGPITVAVFDVSGKKVLSKNMQGTTDALPSDLKTGVYFVRVQTDNGKYCTQKVIIK
ncbi:MAG: hypothetical protein DRI88_03630 [Bacteroidetes bacterium]|nr:MAG: hypothetical protein DRI88_03630 [Bacteroidota bacterium]